LDNTNRDSIGQVDFERVQGMNGIILANKVMNTESIARGQGKRVKTIISYDDGGSWQFIPASSAKDINGHSIPCNEQDCTLNLHGRTDISVSGAIFSAPSAIGMMMGVGNLGSSLLPYADCHTWLTKDAGRTWTKVYSGESLYEFGDQGAILVVADHAGPTTKIRYSWDDGQHWEEYSFTDDPDVPIFITQLITEPSSSSLKFLIIGETISNQTPQQVVITLDFSELQQKKCVLDKGDDSKSDFEKWNPMEGMTNKCLLGSEVSNFMPKTNLSSY
jgi:hypothetical protein